MNPTQSPTNPHAAGKAAHTPTPWEIFPNFETNTCSIGHYGKSAPLVNHVCELPDLQSEDAAFIVRACNSHAALVEALKAIREEATAYPEGGEDCFKYSLSLIAEKARAAIARATGQGEGQP